MKKYNLILLKKQQKSQHCQQVKFISTNILTGEEILSSDQSRIIEQAKFTYSPLHKVFEKQTITTERQGKQHVEVEVLKSNIPKLTIKDMITENILTDKAKNELN